MAKSDYIQVIEFTHPGAQMRFKLGKGYHKSTNGSIYREWNKEPQHKRKFICNKGKYLHTTESKTPISDDILFWGEWEGHSWFEPLSGGSVIMPNGIHYPFFNPKEPSQNTDPWVYGNEFIYAVCKQVSSRLLLAKDSVIIFGTEYKDHFAVDTVFVIDKYTPAETLKANPSVVTDLYWSATINRLNAEYPLPGSKNRVYKGKMWQSGLKELYSFVPCKPLSSNGKKGFQRLSLPHEWAQKELGFQKPGARTVCSTRHTGIEKATEVWNIIVKECIRQEYKLGVSFDEPVYNSI